MLSQSQWDLIWIKLLYFGWMLSSSGIGRTWATWPTPSHRDPEEGRDAQDSICTDRWDAAVPNIGMQGSQDCKIQQELAQLRRDKDVKTKWKEGESDGHSWGNAAVIKRSQIQWNWGWPAVIITIVTGTRSEKQTSNNKHLKVMVKR